MNGPERRASRSRRGRERLIGYGGAALALVIVLVAAPASLRGVSRLVAAYDVATIVLLAMLWLRGMSVDAQQTRARAALEDPGRDVVFTIALLAGLIGIVSAVSILASAPHAASPAERRLAIALALTAVVMGWFVIHTIFTFRYAHLYYYDADGDEKRDGGIDFPDTKDPNDYDFAYFSFVLGMTFQVSDVRVTSQSLRRLALAHGLISFGYNTTIVALVVNIASSLLH